MSNDREPARQSYRPLRWCLPSAVPARRCRLPLDPPPDRPDPAIYSQEELLAAGQAPTFDNPDIRFFLEPVLQNGQYSIPDPWYLPELSVGINNLSATVSAVNVLVDLYWLRLGIGVPRTLLGTQLVSLDPQQRVTLSYLVPRNLYTQPNQFMIGFMVEIRHPYDQRLSNNRGWSVWNAILSPGGRRFNVPFEITNSTDRAQVIHLSVLPNALQASVVTHPLNFAPGYTLHSSVAVDSPANLPASEDVTVIARDSAGNFFGGITLKLYFSQ